MFAEIICSIKTPACLFCNFLCENEVSGVSGVSEVFSYISEKTERIAREQYVITCKMSQEKMLEMLLCSLVDEERRPEQCGLLVVDVAVRGKLPFQARLPDILPALFRMSAMLMRSLCLRTDCQSFSASTMMRSRSRNPLSDEAVRCAR
jgi:hypothetical protein